MMNKLYELYELKPGEVQISVVAKTPEQKALAKMVNEEANEFLRKLIKYTDWLNSRKNSKR